MKSELKAEYTGPSSNCEEFFNGVTELAKKIGLSDAPVREYSESTAGDGITTCKCSAKDAAIAPDPAEAQSGQNSIVLPHPAVHEHPIHGDQNGGKEGPPVDVILLGDAPGARFAHHVAGPTLVVVNGRKIGMTVSGIKCELGDWEGPVRSIKAAFDLVDFDSAALAMLLKLSTIGRFDCELRNGNHPIEMLDCTVVYPVSFNLGSLETNYKLVISGKTQATGAPIVRPALPTLEEILAVSAAQVTPEEREWLDAKLAERIAARESKKTE